MTTNPITGDRLITKSNSEKYRSGWDAIFGNKDNTEDQKEKDNADSKDDTN